MRQSISSLLLISWAILCNSLLAQNKPTVLEIDNFAGLVQAIPSHLVEPGVCLHGQNIDTEGYGALQRSKGSEPLSTPSGFGTLSNPTMLGDCDPNAQDSPRILYQCLNITSPTYGDSGQHILACDLVDTGTSSGIVLGGDISWHQMDIPDELGLDIGYLNGFIDKAEAGGVNFLTCDSGILCICRDQGSASYSNPTTCEWLGSPTRPTAAADGAGDLTGNYQWKVTFVSPLGESAPSKPSAQITLSSNKAAVAIPVGPSGTTARKLYRNKGKIALTNADFETGDLTGWTLSGAGATASTTSDVENVYDAMDSGTETNWQDDGGSNPDVSTTQHAYGSQSFRYSLYYAWSAGSIGGRSGSIQENTTTFTNNHYEKLRISLYVDPSVYIDTVTFYAYMGTTYMSNSYSHGDVTAGWNTLEIDLTGYTYAPTIHNPGIYVKTRTDNGLGTDEYFYIDYLRAISDNNHGGSYAVRLTRSGADVILSQTVDLTAYAGKQVTLTAWVKSNTSNTATIKIYDDGASAVSIAAAHTGDNTWQKLSITRTMDAAAGSGCQIQLAVANTDTSAFFDDVVLSPGSAGYGDYYYLATVSDNTTTSYSDNIADTSLGSAIDSNGAFVPYGEWITYHNERLWSIGKTPLTTQRQLLWYSDDGDYDRWPDSNYIELGNNDGDPATGLVSFHEILYVFRRGSIWRLRGTSADDFDLKRVVSNVGCADGRTIAVSDSYIFFFGAGTVWQFDGYRLHDIGSPLVKNDGFLTDVYIDTDSDKFQAAATYHRNEYILAYKVASSNDYAPYALKYNVQTKQWTRTRNNAFPSFWYSPRTLSEKTIATSWNGTIWDMESTGHGRGYPDQSLEWVSPAYVLNGYLWKSAVDRIVAVVSSNYTDSGDAITLKVYKDATTQKLVTGSSTADASKSFSITTGINILDWKLPSSLNDRVMRTIAVEIDDQSESDTSGDSSELPPKILNLKIQHRPMRRLAN